LLHPDGAPFSLSQLRGKVVLVNFWATWCEPCLAEMPSLQSLRNLLGSERFEVLGVNYQEGPARIEAFTRTSGVTFPLVRDTDGSVARAWGARVFPSSFIVDRDGGNEFSYSPMDEIPMMGNSGRSSDDAIWRGTVQAALLTAAATGVLMFHRGRRRSLLATPDFTESAAQRADAAYLYAACFLAAFIILAAAAFGTYGLFRAVAPGVTGFGDGDIERQKGIAQAISLAALGLGAAAVFVLHWRERPVRTDVTVAPEAI
jgi:thiol-disulfide isomerase/thioredoxin